MRHDSVRIGDAADYLIYREGSGGTIEIFDIAVTSERRKGIGRKLVYRVLDLAAKEGVKLVWAITRADNFIAQAFYEELRFRRVAVLRNFYNIKTQSGHETADAVWYGRDIGSLA